MKFGSLFSGIGGIDLGLERAGMTCRWQVEIDPYCQKVLQKHWKDVRRYSDVREVGKQNLESVDLICGGFPCQPHSIAGKRKASQDERDLWPEFFRIISELEPKWVLAENVPGILSSESGRFFGGILRDLSSCGYDAEWQVLPAAAFGAPHIRERVFIVANNQGKRIWKIPVSAWGSFEKSIDVDRIRENVSNTNYYPIQQNKQRKNSDSLWNDWWKIEPELGRVADGIPNRMDRLKALGNAVVPQIAEWIGNRIITAENRKKENKEEE